MKRFLKKLFLFLLLIIVLVSVIILWPIDKKKQYTYLGGDFIKSAWNYQRIFKDSRNIDIAFIGTSHTLNGVLDSIIEYNVNNRLNTNLNVANIAQKDIGRNMQYAVIKDLFKNKKPELIIIEALEIESYHGHKFFSYMADGEDVLFQPILFNFDYLPNIIKSIQQRSTLFKRSLSLPGAFNKNEESPPFHTRYGFEQNLLVVSENEFDGIIKKRNKRFIYDLNNFWLKLGFNYSLSYVDKILELAKENHSDVIFLYLPYYGVKVDNPMAQEYYMSKSKVWRPDSILDNRSNFINPTHFNRQGAYYLSEWLSDKLIIDYYGICDTNGKSDKIDDVDLVPISTSQ